ncbi:serine/threonine protein kinase [Leptolyngbya sp. AN03gr2]|uniref:serine/threonine protein kinase n=1 Tax=unclassified Leptolyngbya TaxID=2650499 RepID=UPI003D30FF96
MPTLIGYPLQKGKYTIVETLGQGGFGITYKAIFQNFGHTVVIKTLNPATQLEPNFGLLQQQFYEEARRLSICSHPNIVRILDFFIEMDLPFIVMEYIAGLPLDKVVERYGVLPEATAIYYAKQIGEALKVVHQNGLLHRDVKPQNIMLRQGTHQVILIDFGIAREFTPGVTQTHTSLVTPGYAPLEQYIPSQSRTAATDIYGLSATSYTQQFQIQKTRRNQPIEQEGSRRS